MTFVTFIYGVVLHVANTVNNWLYKGVVALVILFR